jgi:hypothetical protein
MQYRSRCESKWTPNLFFLSMKVRIIELYPHTNSQTVSTPLCRQQEHWIRKLGIVFPCGCNDNVGSKGNISSPQCSNVNMMGLFNNAPRRKHSHGYRSYNKFIAHHCSFDSLLPYVNTSVGPHHIRTKLYTVPVRNMYKLHEAPNWISQHSNTEFCT